MNTPREIWRLDTIHIGSTIWCFDELGSTSDTAMSLSSQAEYDGLVILSEHQTAGRGQYGRTWHSRPGLSALFSVLLFPPLVLRRPPVMIAWAAVALAETLWQRYQVRASIKWPNDLLVNGKKICGILTEQRAGQTVAAVLGIGLNVNQTAMDFREAGLLEATSLAEVTGVCHEVRPLVCDVVRQLNAWYAEFQSMGLQRLEQAWCARLGLLGKQVQVELANGALTQGRLKAMSFDALELEHGDGAFFSIPPETVRRITG